MHINTVGTDYTQTTVPNLDMHFLKNVTICYMGKVYVEMLTTVESP